MEKQNRVADRTRRFALLLLAVLWLFVYLGPNAPDIRWRGQGRGHSVLDDVDVQVEAEGVYPAPTATKKQTLFEEVTAANAGSSRQLPTFRNARISLAKVGTTRTIAAQAHDPRRRGARDPDESRARRALRRRAQNRIRSALGVTLGGHP